MEEELVFSRLKPYCVDLLDLLRDPNKAKKSAPSFLPEVADLLRRASPGALQHCLDFTMLPLLLLLDAAVQCRKERKEFGSGVGGFAPGGEALGGLVVSDSVAEGVLRCLEELLMKCHLGSVNQMVVVMKKITLGALLSPSEASEEFRLGIIRCFKAMLLRLQPCSIISCSCKQRVILPTVECFSTLPTQPGTLSTHWVDSEECFITFLRSHNASAAVGHWLSLLLQTAEVEASRGQRGSSNLRIEAFLTLRVLVAKVGTADALAFFLPGIVSRFSKALYASKGTMSGAARSSGAIEHAIRGLTEFLMIVLDDKENADNIEMPTDTISALVYKESESVQGVLEALRGFPLKTHGQPSGLDVVVPPLDDIKDPKVSDRETKMTLHVHRTKCWIAETSANVDKLLSAIFPHLCVHPAERVRKTLVEGIRGLLSNCICTIRKSKLMLLDCLCVLVCDDSEVVSLMAQQALESLMSMGEKFLTENEIFGIFTSLTEGLPRMVLGSEETVALSHARKLLAFMYYAGPDAVANYLFHTPTKASQFLDCLSISLSQHSQFAGSVNKLIMSQPLSPGYLLSIAELKAGCPVGSSSLHVVPKISVVQDKDWRDPSKHVVTDLEFPHEPPWFAQIGSPKLYLTIAGILRLLGLAVIRGLTNDISLSTLVDILLDYLRKLIKELRMRDYSQEEWQTWYFRLSSGQLLRKTSAAVCMINEIMYGLSDSSVNMFLKLFIKSGLKEKAREAQHVCDKVHNNSNNINKSAWNVQLRKDDRNHVKHCIGSILHEYISTEVWDLPVDQDSFIADHDSTQDLPLHFFRDTRMLQQVILDGIGIFSIVLGNDFVSSGFLHSSLYLLLRSLICSSSHIRIASDSVLRALSLSSGHATVGQLVVSNADYIIDSLCRQLRHLDINPHVPSVLAAMLSYIGAAHEILPLLDEPMQAISMELEILGRHQHPQLTLPFLKAVSEVARATRKEASMLPNQAGLFKSEINAKVLTVQEMSKEHQVVENGVMHNADFAYGEANGKLDANSLCLQNCEELLFQLSEMKRYRRTVGSLAGSCLKATIPLLSSHKELACLVALDIIEDVALSLAKVEEAYKLEKQTKSTIEEAMQLLLQNDLEDSVGTVDEADENRLLPAMNKIWPYLILCLKNKITVAVVRRCTNVLGKVVEFGGGDFFVRRFHADGHVIWKLLMSPTFQRKGIPTSDDKRIVLPYRSTSTTEEPIAETSSQKIQAAVLEMISTISSNRRSSVAFETVLKKVSGLVVGIACSSANDLRDISLKALAGLARMDPDLIWLLLADLYYSLHKKDKPLPPTQDLPEISQLLCPPTSSKDYLYVRYGGETFGFDVDPLSVEIVYRKMEAECFM